MAVVNGKLSIALNPPKLRYAKEDWNKLRIKFSGSENIEKNYSACFQDMFVLSILNGKKNGCYVEIGAAWPEHMSNTLLLEKQFDWYGVSYEIQHNLVQEYNSSRINKCTQANCLEFDYRQHFKNVGLPNEIDYLQVDIEPPLNTLNALYRLPFDEYKFSVITFEHDFYKRELDGFFDGSVNVGVEATNFLAEKGYELVVQNLGAHENWYVHTESVDNVLKNLLRKVDSFIGYDIQSFYWGHEIVLDLPHINDGVVYRE